MDGQQLVPDVDDVEALSSNPPEVYYDLSKLTPGERLWLWRISERSKVRLRRSVSINSAMENDTTNSPRSLLEAAVFVDLHPSAYWAAEHDKLESDKILRVLRQVNEPPYTTSVALRVARRRSPLKIHEIALAVGVASMPTFYKLEAAGDHRVVEFWRSQGFKFPEDL